MLDFARLPGNVVVTKIVPDDWDQIRATLVEWSDMRRLNLILTTGGTGFSPRDVTPEVDIDVLLVIFFVVLYTRLNKRFE